MKNLFLLLSILISTATYSQEITQSKTLTNAEEFAAKSGTLIERVWIDCYSPRYSQTKVMN